MTLWSNLTMGVDRYLPVWYSPCVGEPGFMSYQRPQPRGPGQCAKSSEREPDASSLQQAIVCFDSHEKVLRLLCGCVIAVIAVLAPINK